MSQWGDITLGWCLLGRRRARRLVLDGLGLALAILGLLGEKNLVDVGEDTTLGDGDAGEQLVELLVVADGELEVAGDDAPLLVVAGSVAGKLKNLSREVLEDSGEVDWGTSTDTLGVVALAEETVDTTDGELKTGLLGAGLGASRLLLLGCSCRLSTDHDCLLGLLRGFQKRKRES